MASIKTQGTQLYFIDNAAVKTLTCPTGITGLGSTRDQIDVTCLNAQSDKSFVGGLGTPGTLNVPFVFDPTALDQRLLFTMRDAATETDWLIGFSDGTTAPTVVSGQLTMATTRTSASCNGYIADVTIDIATNEVVRGTMTIQLTGSTAWTWKV